MSLRKACEDAGLLPGLHNETLTFFLSLSFSLFLILCFSLSLSFSHLSVCVCANLWYFIHLFIGELHHGSPQYMCRKQKTTCRSRISPSTTCTRNQTHVIKPGLLTGLTLNYFMSSCQPTFPGPLLLSLPFCGIMVTLHWLILSSCIPTLLI